MRPTIPAVRELQFEGFLLHAPDTLGQVSTQEWHIVTFVLSFTTAATPTTTSSMCSRNELRSPSTFTRAFLFRTVCTTSRATSSRIGSGQDRKFTYNFFERFGGYYGGTLNEFRVRANYRPTAKFSVSASETWDRFRLPLPDGNFSVVLASLQGNYSFNRFLTFTSLVQMDTSNAQAVSANLRLRYNYRPDSDLYIIYNVGTQFASIAPANPPQVRETRFAIKYTYSWQR